MSNLMIYTILYTENGGIKKKPKQMKHISVMLLQINWVRNTTLELLTSSNLSQKHYTRTADFVKVFSWSWQKNKILAMSSLDIQFLNNNYSYVAYNFSTIKWICFVSFLIFCYFFISESMHSPLRKLCILELPFTQNIELKKHINQNND
jgi:hypothetical protein